MHLITMPDHCLPSASAADSRWRTRLIISIPAMLVLFTLMHAIFSRWALGRHWDELVASGGGELANDLLRLHLSAMIVLALLAALVGLLLALAVLRPIRALEAVARKVATGCYETPPTRPPAAAELEDLGRSFDDMLARLRAVTAERDRHLMACLPLGAIATDAHDVVTAASPLAARILQLPEQALVGRNLQDLGDELPDATRQLMLDAMAHLLDLAEGRPTELTLATGEGNRITVSSTWLRDSNQAPQGRLLFFRDTAPVRDLTEHLGRTDQLAALGTFCLGLAHELRNPLGAIKGLSQLIQLEDQLGTTGRECVGRMVREVDRIDLLIGRLLDLTDASSGAARLSDVEEIIQLARVQVDGEVEETRRASIVLQQMLGESLPPLRIEAERVAQALAKLLQNAYEASPAGAVVTLSVAVAEHENRPVCEFRVHNQGSTIASDACDRIFDPFYTTRERHSGLGLTIARQIVVQNGGELNVETGPDHVAFVMRFPIESAAAGDRSGP